MNKSRLEAFSDGVIAVIITIMVLELKVPHSTELSDLLTLYPIFFSYILSFINIGIGWSNHHHMIHTVKYVSGWILWANLHWLFWLSLIPFSTAWLGENHLARLPTQIYGINLLLSFLAYYILVFIIIKHQGPDSIIKKTMGKSIKGALSALGFVVGLILSFYNVTIAQIIYVVVAVVWIIPDKRIEKELINHNNH